MIGRSDAIGSIARDVGIDIERPGVDPPLQARDVLIAVAEQPGGDGSRPHAVMAVDDDRRGLARVGQFLSEGQKLRSGEVQIGRGGGNGDRAEFALLRFPNIENDQTFAALEAASQIGGREERKFHGDCLRFVK